MPMLTLDELSLEIGDQPLLRHTSLVIDTGERVCLIGRNGAGKSTLLRLITGEQQPDAGEIRHSADLRISQLAQALPDELKLTAKAYVSGGLAHLAGLIEQYHHQSQQHMDCLLYT